MRKTINPYTKYLIRQNVPYFIVFAILIILTLSLPKYMIDSLEENKAKIDRLSQDVHELQARRTNLTLLSDQKQFGSNNDVRLMASLVPDSEDYFSMILAINEISAKTGFNIISYNIPLGASEKAEKLSMSVAGTGDQESFVNFLKDYNFGGGRLITIDSIELQSAQDNSISLNINFFHKDIAKTSNPKYSYDEVVTQLSNLKGKVNFVLKESVDENSTIEVYPVKPNPFSAF